MRTTNVERIKEVYKSGTRIRLRYMEGERDMYDGLEGTVTRVDDIGQIHMRWDNGRSLAINPEVDSWEVIS